MTSMMEVADVALQINVVAENTILLNALHNIHKTAVLFKQGTPEPLTSYFAENKCPFLFL